MATTYTTNLKLRLDDNLTASARYNLQRLDALGGTYVIDSTDLLRIRSRGDIFINPESADMGGAGSGGTVTIGDVNSPIANLTINALNTNLTTGLSLLDQATGGSKYLKIKYNSALTGPVDSTADRNLSFDLSGSDRSVVLGGDFGSTGGDLSLTLSGNTSLVLPTSGILSSLNGAEVLTNKTLDAFSNSITNLTNASISNSASIDYSKLNLTGQITSSDFSPSVSIPYSSLTLSNSLVNSDINTSANISYSKLNLSNSLVNSDISTTAAIGYTKLALADSILDSDISNSASINRTKLALGSLNHVLINSGSGQLSSESYLSLSRGGSGQDNSSLSFPTSGEILSNTSTNTVSNKSISGLDNTLSNIGYSALTLTGSVRNADIKSDAAIAYSKLNLTNGLVNSDINASAAISGSKINPDFGDQLIRSLQGIQFEEGGYKTTIQAAQSGQSSDIVFELPSVSGTDGQVLIRSGTNGTAWQTITGTGTVTSIDLTAPSDFTVSGGPITSAGVIALDYADQTSNTFLAGPTNGSATTPSFRALDVLDLPAGTLSGVADTQSIGLVDTSGTLTANLRLANGTLSTVTGGVKVSTGGITDNEINSSASISLSKLASLSTNKVVITDGSGVLGTSSVTNTVLGYLDATSSVQTQLNGKQASSTELAAIAGFAGSGLLAKTAANTYAARTLTAGSPKLTVTNGSGVSGNPTVDLGTVSTDDLTEGSNQFFTTERAQDAVGSALADTSSIDFTYNDAGNTISAVVLPAGVDHNSLQNFVANKHIDHSSVSISTGSTSGLSGGGDLTSTRSLLVDPTQATLKSVPDTADILLVADSASSNSLKKVTLASILALGGGSYSTDWTSLTSKTVTHNLGSRDVLIQLYDNTTYEALMVDSVVRTDGNTVTLTASQAPSGSGWRVLIKKL